MNTILITGANRGLGLELVKQYLSANFRVIAGCREPQKANDLQQLAKSSSDNLSIIKIDMNNLEEINQLTKQLANKSIDILFNNAGIFSTNTEFGEIDPNEWQEILKVNTIAPVMLAQALIKQVESSQLKIIANMSSSMGSIQATQSGDHFNYRVSKSALVAATKCMSISLKDKKIITVAIDPGWVQTDMGGASAPLTPQQSVAGICKVLSSLTLKQSGAFIRYDGHEMEV